MYEVKAYHHKPAMVRGDLEEETVMVASELFKTRAKAKAYIEDQVKGCKTVQRDYHRGNETSYVTAFTGYTWINENSGEERQEYYYYRLNKAQAR